MTYEELLISIDLKGYKNVLPFIDKTCLSGKYWFVICDDGDCHLFDRKRGKEDDISKIKEIYEGIILKDIKKIVIPNNVTRIGDFAFWYCNRLMSVTIPNSVISIGNCGFRYCDRLTNVTIPDSVTSIEEYAFYGCINLTSVTIGNNMMSIGDYAFRYCDNLKSLIFKNKTFNQVKSMKYYPWGIEDESIIHCT